MLTGLFAAVSAALGFAFIAIPNIELITASIFLSGLILGPLRGLLVGILAELIFAGLNPMGTSFPPLMAAQLASMGITGMCGGILGRSAKEWGQVQLVLISGIAGLVLTINFDFWTTLSFPLSTGMNTAQTINTLKLGIPFAIPHLAGNTIIFAVIIPPAFTRIRKLVPVMVLASLLILLSSSSMAQESKTQSGMEPDSLELANIESEYPEIETFKTESELWFNMYHDDTGDILNTIPGLFLYDLAMLGQPLYFNGFYGGSEVLLYGIPFKNHYFDLTDYNLLPPGYIEKITLFPSFVEGNLSAEGLTNITPRFYFTENPYSRVNYRDGYYGLGVADFIFSQKLHQNYGFQVGGRISEFNGRLNNSSLDGTNLRGQFHWQNESGSEFDLVYLSNRNKAGITNSSDHRNLLRTDVYLLGQHPIVGEPLQAVLHYSSGEENYGFRPDPSEIGFDFKLFRNFKMGSMIVQPATLFSWYRMESGEGYDYTLTDNISTLSAYIPLFKRLSIDAAGSWYSGVKNFPGASMTLRLDVIDQLRLNGNISRSGRSAAPYTRNDYDEEGDLFLPGGILWRISSDKTLIGNKELEPVNTNSARFFADLRFGDAFSFTPSVFAKQVENPIVITSAGADTALTWANGPEEIISGAGAQLKTGSLYGFRFSMSWTFHNPEEQADFVPQNWGYCWLNYEKKLFEDQLLLVLGIHGKYMSEREGVYNGTYWKGGDENVWGARIIFNVSDFSIFWGNENIFSKEYEVVPGYPMIHREEVWGVNWVFWD